MRVAFVIRKGCERCARIVRRIVEILPEDWEVIYDRECARFLGGKGQELERIEADIIVTVGGDGTALRALQNSKGPVLGINMGGLGFLTEVEIGEVEKSIYRIIRGDYRIERAMKLKVTVNGIRTKDCTNEVVVHTRKVSKIRKFNIYVSGHFLDSVSADGVIVATPIGSTSYSYSAGGPILLPSLRAMVISYLAPFGSRIRPVVVPTERSIRIRLVGRDQDSLVILDGQEEIPVHAGDDIEISVSENYAEFVTLERSFYQRMREKLIKYVVN
ncbi:inorganic polyphosphate/ATP-NAD kinase [Thermogymnomonas acidicola]|uniref:NAD kinase n=1 Tax=Thermogymnomonas acidicola TaxID=399579 RepID=A0AA37F9W9_9ARCH|nr:NAD(+) kinase [Thermogymnomonas acidicola]GGM72410.1 inorganic polyphosphate/ATP-NAD kinase [Thermogymnomonas acidicola]